MYKYIFSLKSDYDKINLLINLNKILIPQNIKQIQKFFYNNELLQTNLVILYTKVFYDLNKDYNNNLKDTEYFANFL